MVTVMVGLQGSGKSTRAKWLSTAINAIVLSSDELRNEHPEWDNAKVFNHLYGKMIKLVNLGRDIIIDATNTTIKARKQIFEALKQAKEKPIVAAWIMTTPVEECKKRVEERNKDESSHFVPLEVIDRYLQGYEIPFYEEGFDSFTFDNHGYFFRYDKEKSTQLQGMMKGFNQNNKHHTQMLGEHCLNTERETYKRSARILRSAAAFHDIGKLFTQTYKEGDPNAHYYNHANVGTYYLLSHLEALPLCEVADIEEIASTLFYINYHMHPFNWNTEKAHNKWRGIFGETKYKNLLLFNECDKARG